MAEKRNVISATSPHDSPSGAPYIRLEVFNFSDGVTEDSVSYWYNLYYETQHGEGVNVTDKRQWSISVTVDGQTIALDSNYKNKGYVDINGVKSEKFISDGHLCTIRRTHASQKIAVKASFGFNFTFGGTKITTRNAVVNATVLSRTKYTITFKSNYGSGETKTATKWYNEPYTLSAKTFSRTDHKFYRWKAYDTEGKPIYWYPNSDGTFKEKLRANRDITLYAEWLSTVQYDLLGGSGNFPQQTKYPGVSLKLHSASPTLNGHKFRGWSIDSTHATGISYYPGSTLTVDDNRTLYAVWEKLNTIPSITKFSVYRVDDNGVRSDDGTHIRANISWECSTKEHSDNVISKVSVIFYDTTVTPTILTKKAKGSTTIDSPSGREFSPAYSYGVRVTIEDKYGNTATKRLVVSSKNYPIDVRNGGKGVTIGGAAESDGFNVKMAANFGDNVVINTMNGNSFADIIIETGYVESGWKYRKWAHGMMEMWRNVPVTDLPITSQDSFGSLFRSSTIKFNTAPYPTPFKYLPTVNMTFIPVKSSNGYFYGASAYVLGQHTEDELKQYPPDCYLIRPTSGRKVSGYINIHAIGWWN